MPDLLAEYHLEIAEIEDAWYEELQASIKESGRGYSPVTYSPWAGDYWNNLRRIQERHGIEWPDDPRAFSIASYLHELAGLEARDKQSSWESHKHQLADPEGETEFVPSYSWFRHSFDVANCMARHFPRFDVEKPDDDFAGMDSLPKAWLYIGREVRILRVKGNEPALRGWGLDPWVWQLGQARQAFVVVRKLLLKHKVAWADKLLGVQYATGDEYLDHLQSIANQLERDEKESLRPELRRAFGIDPAPTPEVPQPMSREEPTPSVAEAAEDGASRIGELVGALREAHDHLWHHCEIRKDDLFKIAADKERDLAPVIRRLDRALLAVAPDDFEDWARDMAVPALDAARGWLDGWLDAWGWRGVVVKDWADDYVGTMEWKWRKDFEVPLLAAARSCKETYPRVVELRKRAFEEKVEAADPPASLDDVKRLSDAMANAPLYGKITPVLRPDDRDDLGEFARFFKDPVTGWPPRRLPRPESVATIPAPATSVQPMSPAAPPSLAPQMKKLATETILGLLRLKRLKAPLLIRFIELIESKGMATHDEIARHVWGDIEGKGGKEDPGWDAIARLKDRANEFFDEFKIRITYRCGAGCVTRHEDPE